MPDCEMGDPNETRSGQTWHQLLLYPSPSSSQLSYISELQTDAGSQPSTPLQQPTRVSGLFGETDESATNYDSGNFSLSESGCKEKAPFATVGTGAEMHHRFVQLNTELYQTKTELLTYKYKWNEIRNEIELGLSKKIDKLLDEKNELEHELEDVRKELARLKAQPLDQNGRDLLRIRSELDGLRLDLSCKEKANECLKQKIQHKQQLNVMAKNEKEVERYMTHLRQQRESDKSQIETLTAQLARESFTKRQIDVSVEKLKAQVKVLSINFSSTDWQRSGAKECESIQQQNRDLQDQCNRLIIAQQQQLKGELAMCTEKANPRRDEMLLLENFRSIQSKNLDLELKLGQCASIGKDIEVTPSYNIVKRSEETIRSLKQDVEELEQKLFRQPTGKGKATHEKGHQSLCSRHGSRCWESVAHDGLTNEEEDVEIRNLRIMLKAIENENRRRLKRYELNNRTLLKKSKEHARERKQAEQRVEELLKEHEKCATLRCEMSSARERCLLMEADLETFKQEAATLRSEKDRLINLLENNCLLTTDRDVWGSLKRAFKELHELKKMRKENDRLHDQLEREVEKAKQLECSIGDWKRAAEMQTAETEEVRAELAEKVRELEESQHTLVRITQENSSLEQNASVAGLQEKNLTEKLHDLERLVRVQEIRLETAHERLKLYEQSDALIAAAKETFFSDLQSLQDAILLEKQEKYELEEEVRELRQNMVNAVGNSLQPD
uniref:Uncharacterized protein n=1 Tax=Anopheles merus TaxID=30066 RepID=A0A182V250_ANOME